MIITSIVLLTTTVFRKTNYKEIYFEDLLTLNEILKEKAKNSGIIYIDQFDSTKFYELKFNYNMFYNTYENELGVIIKLASNVDSSLLEKYISDKEEMELINLLNEIDLDEIFHKNKNNVKHLTI